MLIQAVVNKKGSLVGFLSADYESEIKYKAKLLGLKTFGEIIDKHIDFFKRC